jgi:hypothetical protein
MQAPHVWGKMRMLLGEPSVRHATRNKENESNTNEGEELTPTKGKEEIWPLITQFVLKAI